MTREQREQAAQVLESIWTRYISTFDDIESEEVDAVDTAIVALREVDAMAQELTERRTVMPIMAKRERKWLAEDALRPQLDDNGLSRCVWCGPERTGWFSVQFWVRACYGKRKWMSVTQDWKKKVNNCPMCGRKLSEVEG